MQSLIKKPRPAKRVNHYRFFFVLLLVILLLPAVYVAAQLAPVASKKSSQDINVVIPEQATTGQAGEILKQASLIRNPFVFRVYARFKGQDSRIKAGQYRLNNSLSTPAILKELVDGSLAVETITIPEGFTVSKIADILVSKGLASREKFMWAVSFENFPYTFTEGLPEGEKRLEGYLFPDTYQVTLGSSENSIINTMIKRFENEINELDYLARAEEMGLTLHQAVTIASMVEREAKIDRERPLIAGVIFNRMRSSIPLQIDATVQYALGINRDTVYYKDLEIDSPYNTYKNLGLPPGPIASPGRESLLAVVNPAWTDYYYYVAKPDGSHAFAKTLAEHNANKERYQQ